MLWEGTAESVKAILDRAGAKIELVRSGSEGRWPSENRFERLHARSRREPPRIHDLPVNPGRVFAEAIQVDADILSVEIAVSVREGLIAFPV